MSEHSLISQNPEQIDSPETPGTPERTIEARMVKDRSLESKFAKANIDSEFPWDVSIFFFFGFCLHSDSRFVTCLGL